MKIKKETLTKLAYSFCLDVVILFCGYKYVQPDPKGIGFGLLLTFASILVAIIGVIVLLLHYRRETFLYSWVGLTCLANFYMVFLAARSILMGGLGSVSFLRGLIYIVILLGAILGVYMISNLFRDP